MVNDDVIRYDSKIVDKMANNGVWNTGGHSFSTLKVGHLFAFSTCMHSFVLFALLFSFPFFVFAFCLPNYR